jgi:hypothetical protein
MAINRRPVVRREQEFVTHPSGHLGWLDRTPRGDVVLELSFYSRAKLARENVERILNEWRTLLS